MSATTNIGLFKHDNLTTNTDQFDIDKALNKNWDKIDNKIGELQATVTAFDFKGNVDTLANLQAKTKTKGDIWYCNENSTFYACNGTNWVPVNVGMDLDYVNNIKQKAILSMQEIETPTPKTGENITLTDSKEGKFKSFKISGNSWQATRSGKNILMEKRNQLKDQISWWIDNNLITNTMYFSVIAITSLQLTNRLYIGYWETSDSDVKTINLGYKSYNANEKTVITINLTDEQVNTLKSSYKALIQIYDNNTEIDCTTITFNEAMLSSSNDTTYEEYGASPSLKFPSRTRNCGDNVNLFYLQNENVPNQAWFSIDENQLLKIKQGTGIAPTPIPIDIDLNVGDTVTISAYCVSGKYTTGEISVGLYHNGSDKTWEGYVTFPKGISLKNKTYTTTITVTNTVDTFMPFIYGNPSIEEDIKFYFKVKKGSKASPYSPYNCGNVNLKVQNKNLLNVPQNYVLTGNEIVELNLEAGAYIINWEDIVTQGTSTNMLMMFCYEDETEYARYISPTYVSKSLLLNTTKNVTKVRIYSQDGYNSSQNVTTTFKNLMIRKNGGDYVLHEEQTVTFPLEEGQVLHEGDYLADDGIHHKRGQFVLENPETGILADTSIFGGLKYIVYKVPFEFVYITNWHIGFMCDRIKAEMPSANSKPYSGYLSGRSLVVFVEQDDTLEDVNTKLSGSIVEYDLAEEEIEPYTAEQQVAYNKIKELYSYEDVTHISSDDEIKPKYEVTYLRDLQKLFNNMTV